MRRRGPQLSLGSAPVGRSPPFGIGGVADPRPRQWPIRSPPLTALIKASPEPFVEIHPSMARTYGIQEGDPVRLTTRRGTALLVAHLTPQIRMDTLFVPFHFNGTGRANLLTNAALDQVSRMPEFKVCAVRIEKGKS